MTRVCSEAFGALPDGSPVVRFTLRSSSITLRVLSFGAIVTSLETEDRDGRAADLVLGFDTLEGYINKHPYFGAVIGRVANRIAQGKFSIDGKDYQLAINNGPNSLHGGLKGFDKVLWTPEILPNGVAFSMTSVDGDEGYPGELKVRVTYELNGEELSINYRAKTSKTTPVNLTNHSYFNLAGHGTPTIYDHEVSIEAESYLPVDKTSIPTGFTIGPSGRLLEMETTQPGIQFYTANFLDGSLKGKGGALYPKHSAFCLETQNWPDAVNQKKFPDVLLRPCEEYNHTTWLKFSVVKQ